MYIITLKLNSTFKTICKATGVKMTAKAVGQNSTFRVSVMNNLHMRFILNNFLLLNRFPRLSLNENLLLLNLLSYFFHLVPCIWEL